MPNHNCQISFFLLLMVLFFGGCKDPFEPEFAETDISQLVVEGFVETNGAESKILLSRTTPISNPTDQLMESGAQVSLESDSGTQWDFNETALGVYTHTGFFDTQKKYRLKIVLKNNQQYTSEELTPIVSPEIEEVNFRKNEEGVEILLSTRGTLTSEYFLWEYAEHWIFRPRIQTIYIYNPETKEVDFRKPEQSISLCWTDNLFPKIVLENAGRYSGNFIFQKPIVKIPNLSEKLMQRYSINVRQRAISKEAFDFWEIQRKNSDDIGGIFSPLPSLIGGNFKNISNAAENVIGFVSMGQSSEKRLYINVADVFPWPVFIPEYEFCQVETTPTFMANYEFKFGSGVFIPAVPEIAGTTTIGYKAASTACTDCTLRGYNVKPVFWED
ncbi:DUF4249 domain-containing protein [Rhodonellum sp.]|uniref:DUF4249 domain-containing protein n=1 Tax=Rhodonellum sp. TaxID=2231180 RepID=UPI0027261D2E|nr:DUF4249 domain-containing protein [Rhodonellum sp.]MDO9551731.1 DUF4249 domain-containing protein [Rhodonellum sp.]